MRLLHCDQDGEVVITSFDDNELPAYTILSHTWGADEEEVTFADLTNGCGKKKPGYKKIRFCGEQTQRDGLQHFWIDTCCIDKSDKAELSSAIRSMFRWYQDATRCYVYLSDVSTKKRKHSGVHIEFIWEPSFRSSRWFTRGWTLQELLAPSTVEFFSQEWEKLGDKVSLRSLISKITGIHHEVLEADTLSQFDISERLRWKGDRQTKLKEDMAYSLSGICDVDIAPVYGEGEEEAFKRLHHEVQKLKDCLRDLRCGDPKDDKKRIEDTKGGLLVESYCWVLDNATFQQWQQDPQRQLLWVKGDPGKGKTMLLCGIIDELRNSMPKTALLSYFFCQATFSHLNSATAVLRGLLYMLIIQQPSLASHIYKRYNHAGKSLFEDANAWIALTEIWVDVLRDPGLRIGYLLIDALDECIIDQPQLLHFVAAHSSISCRVKWIVSSRNWPEFEKSLETAANKVRLSLELNAQSISAAVNTFIQNKVSQLVEEEGYDERTRDIVLEYLTANANDTFLWVALACQRLKGTAKRHVTKKLKSIPPGLDPFYTRMLSRISESDDAEICRCVLATTAILFRPVVILELVVIVEPLKDFIDDLESVREIIAFCGSFLTVREDTVYFVHQSAQDFLLAKAVDEIFPSGIEAAHRTIFWESLAVLSKELHRDMYGLCAPDICIDDAQSPQPDPLAALRYSCVYWVDHLRDSKPRSRTGCAGEQQVTDAIIAFLKAKYLYWLEAISLCMSTARCVISLAALCSLAEETRDTQNMIKLVRDAHRFIVHSKGVIESYPLQTYASALLFSPSGSFIRKAFRHEEPNGIAIWPAMSETWSACLHTFEDRCEAVTFSRNSNQLALGLSDGTVKIWDTDSSTYLQKLERHEHAVRKVNFSYDSARLASWSLDGTVKMWNVADGSCLSTFQYEESAYGSSLAFSHDLKILAFVNQRTVGRIEIYDTGNAMWLSNFRASDIELTMSITFSPLERHLAVGFQTTIKIWDAISNKHVQSLEWPIIHTHDQPAKRILTTLAFSPDSALVVAGFGDGTVMVFNIYSGKILQMFNSGTRYVKAVAISRDSTRVVSTSGYSSLKIWDLSNTSYPLTLDGHGGYVISVAFSHDSTKLASVSGDGGMKIWDICGGEYLQTPDDHQRMIVSLLFSNDSTRLVSGAGDSKVKIWNPHGMCLQTLYGHSRVVNKVVFSHHSEWVASISWDRTARIWDLASGQCLYTYEWKEDLVAVALSPDSKTLACASYSGIIKIWDISNDVCSWTLEGRGQYISSLAFSCDSEQLAALVDGDIIEIFRTASGECLQTLDCTYETSSWPEFPEIDAQEGSVAFSHNAARLASVRVDGVIRIWDRNSGECLHTIETGTGLSNISFDESDTFLLTDIGRIAIPVPHDLDNRVAAQNIRFSIQGVGLSLDRRWITYDSINVLWLPPEYRPYHSTVSGNSVGIANGNKVWIITLSSDCLK